MPQHSLPVPKFLSDSALHISPHSQTQSELCLRFDLTKHSPRGGQVHALNLRSTFSATMALMVVVIVPLYYVFVRYASGIDFT